MANRVLLGYRPAVTQGNNTVSPAANGLFVSSPGENVLTCMDEELTFDSRKARSAQVYRGGSQSAISDSGLTWTTGDIPSLGYIPMIIVTEDRMGRFIADGGSDPTWEYMLTCTQTACWSSTTSKLIQASNTHIAQNLTSNNYIMNEGRGGSYELRDSANVNLVVLRIPLQYGKMTESSLW